jgi:hypothetical protein
LEESNFQATRPDPGLLVRGLRLGLRNWPCLVWVYAVNLMFGLFAAAPFTNGLSLTLDHSLEARKIAGTLDVGTLGELWIQLSKTSFTHMVMRTTFWLQVLEQLVLFVFFAGVVVVFVSAEPPRISALLRGGLAFFWRFVRAALLAGCVAMAVLGSLLGLRAVLLDHVGAVYVERSMFLFAVLTGAVVLLIGLVVRLWWDLVEIYIVRNAIPNTIDDKRQVRYALLPAFRLLTRNFWKLGGSFLLAGIAGLSLFSLCLYLWKLLPAHQVWGAALLGQLGLLFLLASRFWQRAIETAMVLSTDPPQLHRDDIAAEELPAPAEEEMAVASSMSMPPLGDPTLQDLLQKLRKEPWANPDVLPSPLVEPAPAEPGAVSEPAAIAEPVLPASLPQDVALAADPIPGTLDPVREPYTVLLERHNAKLPLGEKPPEKAAQDDPGEKPGVAEPDQNSGQGKRPPKKTRSWKF